VDVKKSLPRLVGTNYLSPIYAEAGLYYGYIGLVERQSWKRIFETRPRAREPAAGRGAFRPLRSSPRGGLARLIVDGFPGSSRSSTTMLTASMVPAPLIYERKPAAGQSEAWPQQL